MFRLYMKSIRISVSVALASMGSINLIGPLKTQRGQKTQKGVKPDLIRLPQSRPVLKTGN